MVNKPTLVKALLDTGTCAAKKDYKYILDAVEFKREVFQKSF
jgi:hypothetical protein